MASVVVLTPMRLVDLEMAMQPQQLLPSSDRRNVVELWRVRELREFGRCFSGYRFKEGA
jgi:hypothetical protein